MRRALVLPCLCLAAVLDVGCRASQSTPPAEPSAPPSPRNSDCGDSRPCPTTDCPDGACTKAAEANASTADIDRDGVPDAVDRCPEQAMTPGPLCVEDPARAQGCPCDCQAPRLAND